MALSIALLAACGGGGGSSSGAATGNTATSFGGKVVDGTIEGATVFLDLNNNQTQDSGEPSAVTNNQGVYTLDTSGLTNAQIRAAHLVTVVPLTAKDSDDGGLTLAGAGKRSFTLMSPAEAFVSSNGTVLPAMINPLTTLLSHGMLSDSTSNLTSVTSVVQTRLGVGSVSLTQDVSVNPALHAKAQMIAAAIGEVQYAAQTANVSGATARDNLFAALVYLQQNLPALQAAVDNAIAANSSLTQLAAVKNLTNISTNTASTTSALVPNAPSLVQTAQATTTSVGANMATMLADGSYSGECLLDTGQNGNCNSPKYYKLSGDTSTWSQSYYQLMSGAWASYTRTQNYKLSSSSGWVAGNATGDSGTVTVNADGLTVRDGQGWIANAATRVANVGGKRFDEVSGITVPSAFGASVFPANSKMYFTTMSQLVDTYEIYSGFQPGSHTSLNALIDANATPQNGVGPIVGSDSMQISFNESGSTAIAVGQGTVTLWSCSGGVTSNGCSGGTWSRAGTANYVISTVNSKEILIVQMPYVNSDRKLAKLIFAVNNANGDVVNGGNLIAGGGWNGSMVGFNRTAFDAILAAGSMPATLN